MKKVKCYLVSDFWFYCSQTLSLISNLFDFECTWWRLFQKRVVRTKFDIYVFIKTIYTFHQLVFRRAVFTRATYTFHQLVFGRAAFTWATCTFHQLVFGRAAFTRATYTFHQLVFQTAALNLPNGLLITMGSGSRFKTDIVRGKNYSGLCWVLQREIMKYEEGMSRDCLWVNK